MSTYMQDLRKSRPWLAQDVDTAGTSNRAVARRIIADLSLHPHPLTEHDKARLAAARRLVKHLG
jgi:hypothetical protein